MAVPTIALYASPPSSVCSTPYQCQINSHASYDYDLNGRSSSSSSSTSSSSQKSFVGGLSSLFSSPTVKANYSTGTEDLGSLWHDRGDELSSSFRCSSLSSSLKRDQSPVSVFQGPVSCSTSSSGIGSYSRSPPKRIAGDVCSIRSGTGGLFNGFVRTPLGSCAIFMIRDFSGPDVDSRSSGLLDELTFNMEEGAFYEAEKAHRGQVRAIKDLTKLHCAETAAYRNDWGQSRQSLQLTSARHNLMTRS
ncbi:hypothetical protein HAX54_043990 [Datura stramonium]|uniref:Uncharacterized protein n=1 Tax=Datura stramonium TaxID=4076 RepID=A0ABS8SPB3_DATST|nr:hypothetical protein [Datura stramonium]